VFDLNVDDVAHEMKAPAGTVRSWIHRARTALASQIESEARLVTRR
jgi:DNA-directed RNA polymerase specialized sigma24 family protein